MKRPAYALLAANLALLVLLVAGIALQTRPRDPRRPLTSVTADAVTRVRFDRAGFSLERTPEGWEIAGDGGRFPAREDRITAFLDEVTGATVGPAVTSRDELDAQFGLGDGASPVTLVSTAGEVHLVFGSAAAGADAIYVRRGEEPDVYVAQTAMDFYLRQPASYWAYLRLFPESARPGEMIRASVSVAATQSYELVLGDRDNPDQWYLAEASATRPIDQSAVSGLARQLVDLVGGGFYSGDWSALAPVVRLGFSLGDGRSFAVEVRAEEVDGGRVYVARPEGPALPMERFGGLLYTLLPGAVNRLTPSAIDLANR